MDENVWQVVQRKTWAPANAPTPKRYTWNLANFKKRCLLKHGLPAHISVSVLGKNDNSLVVLAIEPLEYKYLLYGGGRTAHTELCLAYGPLHISLCAKHLITTDEWNQIIREFQDVVHQIPFSAISSVGCLEIADTFPCYTLLTELYLRGKYKNKSVGLHISS